MSTSPGQTTLSTPTTADAVASGQDSPTLTLYIAAASVDLNADVLDSRPDLVQAMAPRTPIQMSGYVGLVTGSLDTIQNFALQEHSGWLLDIAHDICDPLLKRGTLQRRDEANDELLPVLNTDTLQAGTYVYVLPPGVVVALSKISERQNRSRASKTGDAVTMKNRVLVRDTQCWVSQTVGPLANSHIMPKRLGDGFVRFVLSQFCPDTVVANIFDTIFGIALSLTIDILFDDYNLGFRVVSPVRLLGYFGRRSVQVMQKVYDCHVFAPSVPDSVWTIHGCFQSIDSAGLPLLHRRRVTAPRPTADGLPPAGLFRWHYMQCVIKRFGHSDYRSLPNVVAQTTDIKIYDEDDTDSDSEGPADWPTAAWDLARFAYAQEQEEKARQDAVAKWVSTQ